MKKLICFVGILLILCGCNNGNDNEAVQGDIYAIYKSVDSKLVTAEYITTNTDSATLVEEMLDKMGLINHSGVVDGSVYVLNSNISNKVAYIYFNSAYEKMDNINEVIFRAAVVKTLSQIKDVNYVYFYVDGRALTYENSQIVGIMSESDFIFDTDKNLQELSRATIDVFFSNMEGNSLVKTSLEVAYDKTVAMEKIVLEQLLLGPDDENTKVVLPSSVKVLGTSVREGICYVNFDSQFSSTNILVSQDVAFYSVVNTLCQLNNVNKVRIQINGDSSGKFGEFKLDNTYEYNPDIVYKGE